jgi:hypothetical protein
LSRRFEVGDDGNRQSRDVQRIHQLLQIELQGRGNGHQVGFHALNALVGGQRALLRDSASAEERTDSKRNCYSGSERPWNVQGHDDPSSESSRWFTLHRPSKFRKSASSVNPIAG